MNREKKPQPESKKKSPPKGAAHGGSAQSSRLANEPPPGAETKAKETDPLTKEERELIYLLSVAERAGTLREVIKGAGPIFRKEEADVAAAGDKEAAVRVRHRQRTVGWYLHAMLAPLDAATKAWLVAGLIDDQWEATKGPGAREWPGHRREREFDENAALGIYGACTRALDYYCQLAQEGHPDIAGELPIHAGSMIRALNEVVRTRPELVQNVAAEQIDWPMLVMKHYPKESDFAALAARVGLGSKAPVQPQKRHTWKPETSLNRFLLNLIVVEYWGDCQPLTRQSVPHYLDEVLMPAFDREAKEQGGWDKIPEFAGIAQSAAKRGKPGTQRSEIRNRIKPALMAFTS